MSQTDPTNVDSRTNYQEELQVMGEQLVTRVKELLHEGNVRRLIIKQEGHTILEIPLTVGVVGVVLAPMWAALGALGALLAQCSIEVVRSENPADAVKEKVDDILHTDTPPPTL